MNTCQRLPLAGPYQQNPMNNMNQTFDCINPVLNPQAPPILNSNTSPVSVPVPVLHPPGYQPLHVTVCSFTYVTYVSLPT